MLTILSQGLCGHECEVIGITSRHPLGWWGDGSLARVLGPDAHEQDRVADGYLPCLVAMSSAMQLPGAPPNVALVGVKPVNLRLRLQLKAAESIAPIVECAHEHAPEPEAFESPVHRCEDLDAPNVWELPVSLAAIDEAAALFEEAELAARCAELMASSEWHTRLSTRAGNFFAMRARGPLQLEGVDGLQGLAGDWRSDLVWVSVDDRSTYERFTRIFEQLDLERRLTSFCDHVDRMRVYSAFFVVRTRCEGAYFHTDWNLDVGTNAFTMSECLSLHAHTLARLGVLYPLAAAARVSDALQPYWHSSPVPA